ncbi:aldehyde dehydrogenase-like protein [Xylariaceae sp. FL0662B]|nr:aldehyde dehydrogenase-like protein [Xylariaceae sp. FL0662B]
MAPINSSLNSAELNFTTFSNVINGELCSSSSGKIRRSVNPATWEDNPEVPVSTVEDVDRAIQSAQKAQKAWAAVPWSERQKALKNYTDAFEAHAESFVQLLVREQGKTISEGHGEIQLSLRFLRGFCELSLSEELIESNEERKVTTRYTPLGVAAGIVPWNYPIHLACGKLGPALVTGNAFILKPSPFAPYCNLKMAELGLRFFPPGVFQALSGDHDLGPWLTGHPGVDVVSFSGSVAVGKKVMQACSKTLKRTILELGGNDPVIVCADVDPAAIAPKVAYLALANSGQICIIPKRVYVHESIYDEFLSAMVAYVKSLDWKEGEQIAFGPVSNKPQYERVRQLLADIETNQLTLAVGSTKPLTDRRGFFLSPTLVDNPPDNSRIVVEEPFGPVVPVMKWSDESEVIRRANNTEYGLGASVWSRDAAQAERMARQLQAGSIWVNTHAEVDPKCPFPGHKHSAIGVEWGVEGLKGYCNLQTIHIRLA